MQILPIHTLSKVRDISWQAILCMDYINYQNIKAPIEQWMEYLQIDVVSIYISVLISFLSVYLISQP